MQDGTGSSKEKLKELSSREKPKKENGRDGEIRTRDLLDPNQAR
jgi:hypothetical protein